MLAGFENQNQIPGFDNSSGNTDNYTQVTDRFFGGASDALDAGCFLVLANLSSGALDGNSPTNSFPPSPGMGVLLAGLNCGVLPGSHSADVQTTFSAGGVYYDVSYTIVFTA